MEIDIGNSLSSVATPGIPHEALESLDERIERAHTRIEGGMMNDEFGYAALNLPETADVEAIQSATDRFTDVGSIIVAGIGGSALGAATVVRAVGSTVPVYVLDNVDPASIQPILDEVDLARSVLHIVSRSGQTLETMATAAVVRQAMIESDVDWTERTLVTTGPDGPLRTMAERHDLPVLDVPAGIPGRYSALSSVALPVASLAGQNVAAYLDGATDRRDRLTGSLFECPAYAYAAVAYGLLQRGCSINVMMPYAEALETFGEWFAQLWAESLGKDGLGQFPARALGATDQHSQLQLYRAGPRNLFVTFLRPATRPTLPIDEPSIETLDGTSLGALLDVEFEATVASLARASRPSVSIEISTVDEQSIGGLLFDMEAACIMTAELLQVNPFDQPAVEWGKQHAHRLLEDDTADSSQEDGKSLVIG